MVKRHKRSQWARQYPLLFLEVSVVQSQESLAVSCFGMKNPYFMRFLRDSTKNSTFFKKDMQKILYNLTDKLEFTGLFLANYPKRLTVLLYETNVLPPTLR